MYIPIKKDAGMGRCVFVVKNICNRTIRTQHAWNLFDISGGGRSPHGIRLFSKHITFIGTSGGDGGAGARKVMRVRETGKNTE